MYQKKDNSYWENLDRKISVFTSEQNLSYVRNDDSFAQSFDAPMTFVNFFYHEKIKKSSKKDA